jgi:putative oxidoreductase
MGNVPDQLILQRIRSETGMTLTQPVRDALLLVARILVGVVLIAHGWQKFAQYGIGGTASSFAKMGVPLPAVSATAAALIELVGGLALLVGAFTVIAGVLVALDMLGAFVLVHVGNGVFVTDNGFELVWAIAAVALALAAAGPGRFSVDAALLGRRRAVARS